MTRETNSMLILFIKAVSSDAPWQIVWFLSEAGKESLKNNLGRKDPFGFSHFICKKGFFLHLLIGYLQHLPYGHF